MCFMQITCHVVELRYAMEGGGVFVVFKRGAG